MYFGPNVLIDRFVWSNLSYRIIIIPRCSFEQSPNFGSESIWSSKIKAAIIRNFCAAFELTSLIHRYEDNKLRVWKKKVPNFFWELRPMEVGRFGI